MKKMERVGIKFNKWFNEVFKVTNVEKLEAQRVKMENVLDKAKEELYRVMGRNKVKEEELADTQENIAELLKIAAAVKEEQDNDKLQTAYKLYQGEESKANALTQAIAANKTMIKAIEDKIKIYDNKISLIEKNIDILRQKEEYSENIKSFKAVLKELDCGSIKDISKQIEEDFKIAEFQLEDIKNQDSQTVEEFVNENGNSGAYNKFMQEVNKIIKN